MKKFIGVLVIIFSFSFIFAFGSAETTDTYIDTNLAITRISQVKKIMDFNGDCLNGEGVTISIIDTGVQDLEDDRIIDQFNFCNNTTDVSDNFNHGTKVKHIISDIAPASSILVYKVFETEYATTAELVANAVKRSIQYKADIINISGGIYEDKAILTDAITEAVEKGIIIVSVAGNEGRNCGITSPGNDARVITVGATTLLGDDVASYSNMGPDPDTGQIKPDIVAPGYYQYNCKGTSFAAPIVTGSIALLRQKHPQWMLEDIKSALGSTAVPLRRNGELLPPTYQGSGRIDLFKAINTSTLFTSPLILFKHQSEIIKVKNIGNKPRYYSLQWNWNGNHEGLTEYMTPSSFFLKPEEETYIKLFLGVASNEIRQYWYYPTLKVTSGGTEWHLSIVVENPCNLS